MSVAPGRDIQEPGKPTSRDRRPKTKPEACWGPYARHHDRLATVVVGAERWDARTQVTHAEHTTIAGWAPAHPHRLTDSKHHVRNEPLNRVRAGASHSSFVSGGRSIPGRRRFAFLWPVDNVARPRGQRGWAPASLQERRDAGKGRIGAVQR